MAIKIGTCTPEISEIVVKPRDVKAYIKVSGTVCPLPGCGGVVEGTGEQEWRELDFAVAQKCRKCGATWDDFLSLSDISRVTPGSNG